MRLFHGHIAPVAGTNAVMQPFGGGFGQSVAERLQQQGCVVVVSLFELFDFGRETLADGYDKRSYIVGFEA